MEKVHNLPIKHLENPEEFDLQGCSGVYFDEVLYIITPEEVCEWVICHEIIHYLRNLTTSNSPEYVPSNFDETMTDVITGSMNPQIISKAISIYAPYYPSIYLYLSVFQEDALHDFFYGYTEGSGVLTISSKVEHDFFVYSLDKMDSFFFTINITEILNWRDRISVR